MRNSSVSTSGPATAIAAPATAPKDSFAQTTNLRTDDANADESLPTPSGPALQSHREYIARARQRFDGFRLKKPDPTLHRDLTHGWLLPLLITLDDHLWHRWQYWYDCSIQPGELPTATIPRLEFLAAPHQGTRKMLETSLDSIPQHGSWQTWGNWQYVDYFLDWLLFSLGHKGQPNLPQEPVGCTGASNRLYQVFCLDAMLLWPHDYFGGILAENAYGKRQAFYPTPHPICEFMTRMVCDESSDLRRQTFLDPCVGTGRFVLHASNHILRLYAMDIDPTLCKTTLVNGFFYAPWLVRPISWLDQDLATIANISVADTPPLGATTAIVSQETHSGDRSPGDDPAIAPDIPRGESTTGRTARSASTAQQASLNLAGQVSDFIAESAPPHAQGYLQDTEHDTPEQYRFAPVLKRRKKPATEEQQGTLF